MLLLQETEEKILGEVEVSTQSLYSGVTPGSDGGPYIVLGI